MEFENLAGRHSVNGVRAGGSSTFVAHGRCWLIASPRDLALIYHPESGLRMRGPS